jgi:cyclophilin family peptidyl-prolyl cis-trans isomerase
VQGIACRSWFHLLFASRRPPPPHLSRGYTDFGPFVEGMGVVNKIARGDRTERVEII